MTAVRPSYLPVANRLRLRGLGGLARSLLVLAVLGFGCANASFAGPAQASAADPVAWMLGQPQRWPREVTLLKPTEFPLVENGRPAGSIEAPAGQKIKVVKLEAGGVVVEFHGVRRTLPLEATDLEQRAISALAALDAAKQNLAATPATPATPPPSPTVFAPVSPAAVRTWPPRAPAKFTHPGLLSTQADLKRMAVKVAAGEQPWKGSWDILVANTDRMLNAVPEAEEKIRAGGRVAENYMRLGRDCARTYQLALRYHGSGDPKFADKAVEILNAWAVRHQGWEGDSNLALRSGIYGYQFACAAELLRDYGGWRREDFKTFQAYMLERFYPANRNFLRDRRGVTAQHYWANWTLANQASMMAIGVLCDEREIFEQAVNYFVEGEGTQTIANAVNVVHPNGLGQWQESGRDQGHTAMGPQLMGAVCEIAWNQGIDLYGHDNNRFLAAVEYISKYNLWQEVPFSTYVRVANGPWGPQDHVMAQVSSGARGIRRPGWDLVYNHYVNRMGLSAPYTAKYAEGTRPEGGGFNFGGNSGGFDGLGFTTLTHSRDPITAGAPPSGLRATVRGRQVTLAWWGSAHAISYNVKRATAAGGPYATIAMVSAAATSSFVDAGLTPGATYYYAVSANNAGGESAAIGPAKATASAGITRQAEFASFGEGVNFARRKHPDANGARSVELTGAAYVEFKNVDGGAGGAATLEIRYALGDADRTAQLIVNDVPREITLAKTGDWAKFAAHKLPVKLNSGRNNTLRIAATGERWSLDEITVTPATPDTTPLPAPAGLTAEAGDPGEMILSWTAVPGAESYIVKRAATRGGAYAILADVSETSFTDINMGAGGPYYYVVSALKTAGESVASNEARGREFINASLNLVFSDPRAQAGEGVARAFDGKKNTKWFTGDGHASATLQADFGAGNKVAVVRYDITSGGDKPARDPKDWELQASHDGRTWTTLDTREGQAFTARLQTSRYRLGNGMAYRYYRLNLRANAGGDSTSGLQLAEWALLVENDRPRTGVSSR